MPTNPQRTLGKYPLIKRLGEGGMAEVWLARHPTLGRDVAIKVLHPHLARKPGVAERFQREAQVIAVLQHPHIIQVYDLNVSGDDAYLVMEYVAGSTLAGRLGALRRAGQHMGFDEVWPTFAAIAGGVARAHQSGVIHRDLKPGNVLLRADGTPVLADFGLAHLVEGARYTQTGVLLGTPAYMSPEQCNGQPVDARTDIYALGVMLFEMLTGQQPFQADHPVQLILKHLQEPPPRPASLRPDLPAGVESAILRALSKPPDERFATVGDMLAALALAAPPAPASARAITPALAPGFHPSPLTLSVDKFSDKVKAAFNDYASLVELARSPLASGPLVAPALVLDDERPSPDDRGRALRVALRWAVERLAPAPRRYALGERRPHHDPTWQDPLWWRYNILRHRYLEPLRPDDFQKWYGPTRAIIALTGIPNRDKYYTEQERAIGDVALFLRDQITQRLCDDELQRLAAQEMYQPLKNNTTARDLLGIAATFRGMFPRALLLDMAREEKLSRAEMGLDYLLAQRLLQPGAEGRNLAIPAVIQAFVHARQSAASLGQRHQRAALFRQEQGQPIEAAWHLKMGGRADESAHALLQAAGGLVDGLEVVELRHALLGFTAQQLAPALWSEVQMLLSDLWRKAGDQKQARQACRLALEAAVDQTQQARAYRRLGKLHEDHNQTRALTYYQQAADRFPPQHPERLDLLKDRAWLHIHRREWAEAEVHLTLALDQAAVAVAWHQRADVHNALSGLYRRQEQYARAISHAQQSLVLREENGDFQGAAESCSGLGLIYARQGEFTQAIAAHQDALSTFRQVGNREAMATVYLNIGVAHYHRGRWQEAVESYRESLVISQEIELPLLGAKAHYNLAEALVELGQIEEACQHWQDGHALSQRAGLDDQLKWYASLWDETPALADCVPAPPLIFITQAAVTTIVESDALHQDLDLLPAERMALEIARRDGRVTPQVLIEPARISKSTATRRLTKLVEIGLLERKGKGRGTFYVCKA